MPRKSLFKAAPEAKPETAIQPEAAPATETPSKAALYAAARAVFAAFDGAVSLPIKPVSTFKAYRATLGVLKPGMRPSPRQAATLCVAVLASGQRFNGAALAEIAALSAESAKPETDAERRKAIAARIAEIYAGPSVTFPRRFNLGATGYAAENGATADCVSSGLASYDAATEAFTVTVKQAAAIRGMLGKRAAPAFA